MWIWLALWATAAEPADMMGPAPSHEVLRPVGLHRGGVAKVPGPPADCQAKVQVYVDYKLCKDLGVPRDPTARPVRMGARAQATPPIPDADCALVCTPGAKLANWSYLLPAAGYRGTVTCPVSQRLVGRVEISDSNAAPTAGATVQWQTDLNLTDYRVEDASLLEGHPKDLERMVFEARRWLVGEGACPAGQPAQRK